MKLPQFFSKLIGRKTSDKKTSIKSSIEEEDNRKVKIDNSGFTDAGIGNGMF